MFHHKTPFNRRGNQIDAIFKQLQIWGMLFVCIKVENYTVQMPFQ